MIEMNFEEWGSGLYDAAFALLCFSYIINPARSNGHVNNAQRYSQERSYSLHKLSFCILIAVYIKLPTRQIQ